MEKWGTPDQGVFCLFRCNSASVQRSINDAVHGALNLVLEHAEGWRLADDRGAARKFHIAPSEASSLWPE